LIKTDEWWKSMMEHRELANKIVDGIIDKWNKYMFEKNVSIL
jgi:hypothetical protein